LTSSIKEVPRLCEINIGLMQYPLGFNINININIKIDAQNNFLFFFLNKFWSSHIRRQLLLMRRFFYKNNKNLSSPMRRQFLLMQWFCYINNIKLSSNRRRQLLLMHQFSYINNKKLLLNRRKQLILMRRFSYINNKKWLNQSICPDGIKYLVSIAYMEFWLGGQRLPVRERVLCDGVHPMGNRG
jgi:hypothetical protein